MLQLWLLNHNRGKKEATILMINHNDCFVAQLSTRKAMEECIQVRFDLCSGVPISYFRLCIFRSNQLSFRQK